MPNSYPLPTDGPDAYTLPNGMNIKTGLWGCGLEVLAEVVARLDAEVLPPMERQAVRVLRGVANEAVLQDNMPQFQRALAQLLQIDDRYGW